MCTGITKDHGSQSIMEMAIILELNLQGDQKF